MKYVTPKKAEKCAREVIEWALKHDVWESCGLYVNGKFYCAYKADHDSELIYEGVDFLGDKVRIWKSERDVSKYLEYCNRKEHFISMCFDGGSLYDVLNFTGYSMTWCAEREDELREIFKKYGYYYELGTNVDLSAYKI